ncbi:hypothetical protein AM1BK_49140 [Neobacillus kokaensis]|uniref:Uncharacterized protein n=1 Tax=Neobacillus kokaensis TaxID=2759023 RepID=A0ABQ3NBR3_9BACI|nr:hypothetical protein AM1BK_49140 [Neobacillus kokaensis]
MKKNKLRYMALKEIYNGNKSLSHNDLLLMNRSDYWTGKD